MIKQREKSSAYCQALFFQIIEEQVSEDDMLMCLHSMDSIPDTMIFALEDDNGSLQVPQMVLKK